MCDKTDLDLPNNFMQTLPAAEQAFRAISTIWMLLGKINILNEIGFIYFVSIYLEVLVSVCLWNQRGANICYGIDVPAVYNRIVK